MSQENKALIRRVFEEIWNKSDLSVVDEIYAPDYVAHIANAPAPVDGPERFKQFVALLGVVSPDLQFRTEDQIAEGDKVATRWTAIGSPAGGVFSGAAAGAKTTVTGISIHRIVNGRIAESWDNWDALSALQALGPDVFESVSLSI